MRQPWSLSDAVFSFVAKLAATEVKEIKLQRLDCQLLLSTTYKGGSSGEPALKTAMKAVSEFRSNENVRVTFRQA